MRRVLLACLLSFAAGLAAAATLPEVWSVWTVANVEHISIFREEGKIKFRFTAQTDPKLDGAPTLVCTREVTATAAQANWVATLAKGTLLPLCPAVGVEP